MSFQTFSRASPSVPTDALCITFLVLDSEVLPAPLHKRSGNNVLQGTNMGREPPILSPPISSRTFREVSCLILLNTQVLSAEIGERSFTPVLHIRCLPTIDVLLYRHVPGWPSAERKPRGTRSVLLNDHRLLKTLTVRPDHPAAEISSGIPLLFPQGSVEEPQNHRR
jgi:hypothetical protein